MDAESGQLEVVLRAAGVPAEQVPWVPVGADPATTAAGLDAATLDEEPPVIVVTGPQAAAHAGAWLAARPGWLVLEDPAADRAVLAPVATVARELPPGRWRGRAASPTGLSDRAALAAAQRHDADRLRAQLLEERAWVATEAERARGSRSWRIGHGLTRAGRRLTFRRDRGTDALQRIVERMRQPPP